MFNITNVDWNNIIAMIKENEKESESITIIANEMIMEIDEHPNNSYAQRNLLLQYIKCFSAMTYKSEITRELYKNAFEFLNAEHEKLSNILTDDLKELDICYTAKAYKATLILAGAILEALLLDWLSEIDGKDYFDEPYKIVCKDNDGKQYVRKGDLYAYIEHIEEITHPEWMEASEKAHFIRENRNTVHAQIHLKKEYSINAIT